MRVSALVSAFAIPATGTDYTPVVDMGDERHPFLPGATGVFVLAERAAAQGTFTVQGTDDLPDVTAVDDEAVGSTDAYGDFAGALDNTNVVPGSVVLTVGTETVTDDGAGVLTGDEYATGTIDYATGDITLADASLSEAFTADYSFEDHSGSTFVTIGSAVVETTAKTTMVFATASIPQYVRVKSVTAGSGAGALGLYALGN